MISTALCLSTHYSTVLTQGQKTASSITAMAGYKTKQKKNIDNFHVNERIHRRRDERKTGNNPPYR